MKKFYSTIICLLGLTALGYAQCTITSTSVVPTGLTVNATGTGTGAAVPAYGWDWGDTTVFSIGQTRSHTYAFPGAHNVCFTYLDAANTTCRDTVCQIITVAAVGINEANAGVSTISASPNPFGASTTFSVNLTTNSDVEISVFDVTGKKVETVKDETMSAGKHAIDWTPANLAEGVYFIQMVVNGSVLTQKIVHTGDQ